MVDSGLFEIAVLAGIFLLFLVVAAIALLTYKRYSNKTPLAARTSASAVRDDESAARQQEVEAGARRHAEAETAALQVRADADTYAGDLKTKADDQLRAVEAARRET
jgi:hypothetical protein